MNELRDLIARTIHSVECSGCVDPEGSNYTDFLPAADKLIIIAGDDSAPEWAEAFHSLQDDGSVTWGQLARWFVAAMRYLEDITHPADMDELRAQIQTLKESA